MSKPRPKKTTKPTRAAKPAPAKQPAAAPPVAETAPAPEQPPVVDAAGMFDEQRPEGAPAPDDAAPVETADQVEPADQDQSAVEGTTEEAGTEAAAADAAIVADESDEPVEASAVVTEVKLGTVFGQQQRVPIDDVISLLGDDLMARVDALRGKSAREDLARIRATDGRCAPVFFSITESEDEDGEPVHQLHIVNGFAEVAAAMDLGLSHVFMVTIANGDVGAFQTYLTGQARERGHQLTEDEELHLHMLVQDE